LQSKIGP